MNKLPIEKRAQILGMLVEGNSMRSTSRMADCSINTVSKLLVDVGSACGAFQDLALRNLPCKRIQVDEIWSFVYSKQRNVPEGMENHAGDIWTWTALCADTKLMCNWMVGTRDAEIAKTFILDLSERLANRVQLTSDGYRLYLNAVEEAFGGDIDYAMLVKIYTGTHEADSKRRYSPAECKAAIPVTVSGNPDEKHISTSYVERQNLTMRMGMRRFTRLTNAFSKKVENHAHAIALHFMYYNFGRIHKTLRVTPAMEAGLTDHIWSLEDIAALAD